MHKKDYELIASVCKRVVWKELRHIEEKVGAEHLAITLANAFEDDNPAFNRSKFLKAVGFEEYIPERRD